ncbi:hypothetical protein DVR12_19845 [Chitinophaga silvatica]|uniref:Uncharacterized protein n=1 Tax=Chitinophaga silvatica TaxID=2282649 RepID=A0A3E1Y5H7_9BACT|nr:hypothetical protein [Chitinophaga silvatica]RFS19981.1 hypothetical protein DVR12_19845 [Chitinophaga silvatica]
MDVGFEFLLPIESKISSIKFEQPVYEWQGEKFPQGQEEAWFHYFKLIRSNIPRHIISLLPDSFQNEQWQCISIIDGIDDLVNELSVNVDKVKKNNVLLDLFSSLIGIEKRWVIVFEPDYDCINEVLEGNVNIAFRKIVDSLTIERDGFVIWFERKD